jgi:hypothetical protein
VGFAIPASSVRVSPIDTFWERYIRGDSEILSKGRHRCGYSGDGGIEKAGSDWWYNPCLGSLLVK